VHLDDHRESRSIGLGATVQPARGGMGPAWVRRIDLRVTGGFGGGGSTTMRGGATS
jgi:hypothetical protein